MNSLVFAIENRLANSWEKTVFTNYGTTVSYSGREIFQAIKLLHSLIEENSVEQQDKVILIGRNSAQWCIAFLAVITYGAVVVPVLPEFSKNDVKHISSHAEAKLVVASPEFVDYFPKESKLLRIENYKDSEKYQSYFSTSSDKEKPPTSLKFSHPDNELMAVLSYTSGTLGFTKGVMLSFKNIYANVRFGLDNFQCKADQDKLLSFLPLSHIFGCIFEFLYPFCTGMSIHFIEKIPAPTILLKAFQQVRPKLIFMVPLLLEKIYKKKIYPILSSKKMKFFLRIPLLRKIIYKKVKQKLIHTFGKNFFEVIIGGAALNPEVEAFLRKIKFPLTVGYGMTECAPLISYSHYHEFKPFSCGKIIERMEAKIDSKDPENEPGEIMVKGDNVMLGYYKDEKLTKQVIDKDGWLKTGDVGVLDNDNHLYIKGRNKNMLLGPTGQNIYPEEIEAKINHLPQVEESLVIDTKNNKLVALVYPDLSYCQSTMPCKDIEVYLNENRNEFNKELPRYMQLTKFIVVDTEFEKTPKKSIKRFLYTNLEKFKADI